MVKSARKMALRFRFSEQRQPAFPVRKAFGALAIIALSGCSQPMPEEITAEFDGLPEKIDFNFHVRPILTDRCYPCHGPDPNKRKVGLRFDIEEVAKGDLPENPGNRAIVPGKPSRSKLVERIISHESDLQMPPPESNLSLSAEEKAVLIKWIEQGAQWKKHWAFLPPEKAKLPDIEGHKVYNPIDNFVIDKLLQNGLTPSPEADKERLIRRVTMDLTGLPPTISEIDDFVSDDSGDAYERLVDRLLATDAYAERMAMDWMDLSRYADSHGMHADGWRFMWPWRDWVIQSLKENMPYDQFVTWQLAGDLLPNATRDQKLATAFHRNHPMTAEGGVVDEEFRLEYVADRTNTTATAFLGLTLECARCHDHKFDPISQREYYQMSSFFNNVKELGMTGDDGNFGPMLLLPDSETDKKIQELDKQITIASEQIELSKAKVVAIADFVEKVKSNPIVVPTPDGHYQFESITERRNDEGKIEKVLDNNLTSTVSGDPELIDGKSGKAIRFDSEYELVFLKDRGNFELNESFSAGCWIRCDKPGTNQTLMGTAGDKNTFWRGWEFHLDTLNQLGVRLINSFPHNYIQVTSEGMIPKDEWTHVFFTYDGTGNANGIRIYIDGKSAKITTDFDQLYKSIRPLAYIFSEAQTHKIEMKPIQVGRSGRNFTGDIGAFQGSMDNLKLFEHDLTEIEVAALFHDEIKSELALDDFEDDALMDHYLNRKNPSYQGLRRQLSELRKQKLGLIQDVDEVMVMEEMPIPRTTYILKGGQYDKRMEEVEPGTPKRVLDFADSLPKNRLGLAKWLFDEQNPLTARVAVNRYWQLFFNRGLVTTPHDFGSQGAIPSHPELLDWLAVSFRESGWDIKALSKIIVMSATYRQSSFVPDNLFEVDPQNVLLARGPSYRLPAEMIRDNALAASGLLSRKVGGPSAKPYQSDSLWIELGNFSRKLLYYTPDTGDDLYRRTLYTFIRRTSPHPYMMTFDATNRSICTVKREITNTPLQALILLNDPQFVEAARILAERVQDEGGDSPEEQIRYGFRLTTGRIPESKEIEVLVGVYSREKERFEDSPNQAEELLEVGDSKLDPRWDPSKTAALAMVASTMLNMDEAYMKR